MLRMEGGKIKEPGSISNLPDKKFKVMVTKMRAKLMRIDKYNENVTKERKNLNAEQKPQSERKNLN